MAECTPGPWTIEEYGDEEAPALVIHKDSGTRVCFMATAGSHGDPARIEADAHLICAALDMLATLLTVACPGGGWNGMPKELDISQGGVGATVKDCLTYGACGCIYGDVVKKATRP